MSTVVQGILLAVIGVLLFGLIIFIHEFGHFFTAKLSHVCVNEFSIGMGPKLFSFTRGETQYSLRLLPIGGYCAMEGEDEKSDDPRAFGNRPVWQRMIVVAAGGMKTATPPCGSPALRKIPRLKPPAWRWATSLLPLTATPFAQGRIFPLL